VENANPKSKKSGAREGFNTIARGEYKNLSAPLDSAECFDILDAGRKNCRCGGRN
jgi:hypothetical protein